MGYPVCFFRVDSEMRDTDESFGIAFILFFTEIGQSRVYSGCFPLGRNVPLRVPGTIYSDPGPVYGLCRVVLHSASRAQ